MKILGSKEMNYIILDEEEIPDPILFETYFNISELKK